jgi:Tfp pilus assembly protein PilF/peroxiredoxin
VTVETDQLRRTKIVQIGSGFLSQSSKELLFGLGKSQRVSKATVVWPGGATETLPELPLNQRSWIEEGKGVVRSEPFRKSGSPSPAPAVRAETPALPSGGTWLYEPFPAPDFALRDLDGEERSLSGLKGRPALMLFWATWAPTSRQALLELARAKQPLAGAGAAVLAVAVDPPADEAKVRAASRGLGLPVLVAGEETAGAYGVLNRYLFDRREDMRLPTVFLVNSQGEVVKVYREPIAAAPILEDLPRIEASAAERLARAVPFAGTFSSSPGRRNYFQYGLELSEQGYDAAALVAFQRVVKSDPSAMTFYNLGTLYMRLGQPVVAKGAFEHALELQADYPEASNTLGALLAQNGDVPGAIARFRAALKTKPEYPDALNNLGYALFQAGQAKEAHDLYQKALALQPDFPEAFNNLGIFFGRSGDLGSAESWFRKAVASRAGYGEATNNLALVLAARGDAPGAILLLQRFLEQEPRFEMAYVTLAKVYLNAGRRREGVQVLELLLQRNPKHPIGLQILQQVRGGG